MASGIRQFSPSSADLSSVPRFPVLVQVHQPPYLWKTATTGRHFHPRSIPSDPTPPPWEAERIRDNLARDLEYLERQVPPFLRHQLPHVSSSSTHQQGSSVPLDKTGLSSSISARLQQERSSSSGFQSGSKTTTSTFPSGAGSSGVGTGLGSGGTTSSEVLLRPVHLSSREEERLRMGVEGMFPGDSFPPAPTIPSRSFIPPRTYENWPRREHTPPIYAMARSPSFDIEETQLTVPLSEASPGTRTLLDMSVDDPYEFDAVIPETSPEISYPSQSAPSTSMTRFKRTREKYENMEARVAAMKEEFFEYRCKQKKRMESAC